MATCISSRVHGRAALGTHEAIPPLANCFQDCLAQYGMTSADVQDELGNHQPPSVLLPRSVKPQSKAAAPFISATVLQQPLQRSLVPAQPRQPCRAGRPLLTAPG